MPGRLWLAGVTAHRISGYSGLHSRSQGDNVSPCRGARHAMGRLEGATVIGEEGAGGCWLWFLVQEDDTGSAGEVVEAVHTNPLHKGLVSTSGENPKPHSPGAPSIQVAPFIIGIGLHSRPANRRLYHRRKWLR